MIFVGDIKRWQNLERAKLKAERENDYLVQIGDLGFESAHLRFMENFNTEKHKVLFGNHDDYKYLNQHHSLGGYGFWNGIFFIRGAKSPDKHTRLANGYDWFVEEELTYRQGMKAIELYEQINPSVLVTHAAPQWFKEKHFKFFDKSLTNMLLDEVYNIHQPDIWIFGHYHKSLESVEGNTWFKCLDEDEIWQISNDVM